MRKPKAKLIITDTDHGVQIKITSDGINKIDLALYLSDTICDLLDEFGAVSYEFANEFVKNLKELLDKHLEKCKSSGEVN